MPMTEQEKELFDTLLVKYESEPCFDIPKLEEARLMCMGIADLPLYRSRLLLTHAKIPPEYVDLMFEAPSLDDVRDILTFCPIVRPRHLDMAAEYLTGKRASFSALQIDDVWEEVLLEHPLCTDAMKVKYNLLRSS